MANISLIGWVTEPNGRGTFGIVKSCTITLTLCVYSALRLNIPRAGSTAARKFLIKASWVLIGMFAPELVVFFAWDQRRHATWLTGELESIFSEQEAKDPLSKRRYKWTQTHSLCALMGGFAVDTNVKGEDPYIPGSPIFVLQDSMLLNAAKNGFLPDVSKDYIKDKSKADSMANIIVIVQATWFILQVVMRWATKLPVTALELNTIAHAICALAMYVLWWDKPLDIQDPILLTAEPIHHLTAFYWELGDFRKTKTGDTAIFSRSGCASSRKSKPQGTDFPNPVAATIPIPAREALAAFPDCLVGSVPWSRFHSKMQAPFYAFKNGKFHESVTISIERQYSTVKVTGISRFKFSGGQADADTEDEMAMTFYRRWALICELQSMGLTEFHLTGLNSTSQPYRCMVSAHSIDISPALSSITGDLGLPHRVIVFHLLEDRKKPRREIRNISAWSFDFDDHGIAIFVLCALAYGGVHAIAWNDYFPTETEQLLWRISSIYVAALGTLAGGSILLLFPPDSWTYYAYELRILDVSYLLWAKELSRKLKKLAVWLWKASERYIQLFVMITGALALLFYGLARGYLVIEALVSLRHQPVEVYSTPTWPQYLPHL